MKKLKKLLASVISTALLITTIPINSFSVSYPIVPQFEFSNFAKITSANFCDSSDTTIINIQDLHNNKEVQDNIYKLLDTLNKQFNNLEVYIEGASDNIDYNKLSSSMEQKDLSALMNALYDNDSISGAEFFGYKNNKILKPTEQKDIYDTNIQNYSFLIKNKQQINNLLFTKYIKIRTLDKYLTKEQRNILKFYNAYLNKKVSSEKFYRRILLELNKRNISTLKYINTKLYIDVLNMSKKINQKFAEQQLQKVISNLKTTISYQEYVNLLKDSKNLSDINVIFAYLSANINDNDKITKYPDLFRMINLREISSLINPLDLIEEEREMLEDVLLSYSKNIENKDVVFVNLFFQVYKKLLLASISSSEYFYYKQNYSRFFNLYYKYLQENIFDLYRYSSVAENFNELNLKRNIAFVNNITSKQIVTNKNENYRGNLYNINKILCNLDKTKYIKVIISGGFHTQGINELLKQKEVSYITLTPNVKDTDLLYEQNYLNSILEQAEADINAISKRPFLEQKAPIIIDNIVSSLDSILNYLGEGKSFEEIENIINGVIVANSLQDFVTFHFDLQGQAIIDVDGKNYELSYESGKIKIKTETSTTLAKNVKSLIKEALKIPSIRTILTLGEEYNKSLVIKSRGKSLVNRIAEKLLMEQNILLPWFASAVMRAIVTIDEDNDTENREYKILESVIKKQYTDLGEEYPEIKSGESPIKVGKSNLLVGAKHDGYGNVEEYGSLFYVVWEKNVDGSDIVKEIFISDVLFSYLKSFSDKEVEQFFNDLITHERLELIATSGKSDRYNLHYKDFSRTSEGFHKYIREGADFSEFIKESGLSLQNVERQKSLLQNLDKIISYINEQNSEYSGIISLVSMENSEYSDKDIEMFLGIRVGEEKYIYDANVELADKICKKLKQEYDLLYPDSFDVKKFIKFINENYTFVYKKSNDYMHFNSLLNLVKLTLKKKYIPIWTQTNVNLDLISTIDFPIEEIDDEEISLDQKSFIGGRNIFFVEDIISRNSKTYNRIYNKLISYGANKVQAFVLFDLSKEPKGINVITDKTYSNIIENPKLLINLLSKTEGRIKKYVVYWLVKLLKDDNGVKILQEISKMNKNIVRNLIIELFNILENKYEIIGVKNSEIVELILLLGIGEKIDLNSLTKQNLDNLLEKYNIKFKYDISKPLEVRYDDWKDNIPTLIAYSYMCGYQYIDANGISNLSEKSLQNLTNKSLIERFCAKFNISLIDKKTKLKYFHSLDKYKSSKDVGFYSTIKEFTENYKNSILPYEKFVESVEREVENFLQEKYRNQNATYRREKNILIKKYIGIGKLEKAKSKFEIGVEALNEQYDNNLITYDELLDEINSLENEYRRYVKEAMIQAKEIALEELRKDGIYMNDSMFAIIIGGSLAKGNIMKDSDIYYDIIVKNGIISKSIEQYFTPLYSSILREFGLLNYQVLKYSTTSLDKRNINTFVDEQEVVPFLNYEVLETENKDSVALYEEYMKIVLSDSLQEETAESQNVTLKNLDFISKMYYRVSKTGKGWIGKSYYSIYNLLGIEDKLEGKIFTTRWSLMTFETILNKIIFQYFKDFSQSHSLDFKSFPISVEDQIKFISENIFIGDDNLEAKKMLAKAFEAWKYLSACRYDNNNTWTSISEQKRLALEIINEFTENYLDKQKNRTLNRKIIKSNKGFLKVIEEFVYDNSTNIQVYRNGYDKYYHLQEWKNFSSKEDEGLFLKAQAIVLLLDMGDTENIREKLKSLGFKNLEEDYLPSLIDSIERIKKIDKEFENFTDIEGEKSLQNYWDLVAKMAGNEETLLALIAHKLTEAKFPSPNLYNTEEEYNEIKERNILLVHSIYLPLSRRFGNSPIYEYVRNDLFESSNPQEYLNLLNIIETLYGIPYTQFYEYNEDIKTTVAKYLKSKQIPESAVTIKFRPKTLYSIHEKLNSERRKDEIIKKIGSTEKGLVKFILNSKDPLFKDILKKSLTNNIVINDEEKKFIISHIDNDYESLSKEQKEFIDNLIYTTRRAIFSNYEFVNHIKSSFDSLPGEFKDKTGLRNMEQLKKYLQDNSMYVELFFVELFSKELNDLIGLHVVVEDKEYDEFISDAMVGDLKQYFGSKFDSFEKDKHNKQARLKISAKEKSLPIEMCFYKKTNYEEETYGFYNLETISAPHYQYKTGRKIQVYPEIEKLITELKILESTEPKSDNEKQTIQEQIDNIRTQIKKLMSLVLFDGTFIHEMDLSFVVTKKQSKKQFVFTPDEYKPTSNLDVNRSEIMISKGLDDKTIFFVEFEDGCYILDLPKGATVYELINSKYFADTMSVSVYDENGEPLGLDVKLEDAQKYKVIKNDSAFITPKVDMKELELAPTRTKLKYLSQKSETKSNITSFFEKIETRSDVSEAVAILLFGTTKDGIQEEPNSQILDKRELTIEKLVDKFYDQNSKNKILQNKENLKSFLDIILNLIDSYGLEDITPSMFIKRSTMIANHYNLSNMFELFEAIDYGIIDFNEISNYYKTCIFIKTKSENITEDKILSLVASKIKDGSITKVDVRRNPNAKYNLIINDSKYYVEYDGYEFSFLQELLESKSIHFDYVVDKSSNELDKKENKEKIFITMDYARPRQFLPLMSLGNNIEKLVKFAMLHHPYMVREILGMTSQIASGEVSLASREIDPLLSMKLMLYLQGKEQIDSLLQEYPILMMQILLGRYLEDSYEVLSSESQYLLEEEVSNIKQTMTDRLKRLGIYETHLVISRTLDLVASEDTYSFATMGIEKGIATLYVSENFLRELYKKTPEEKQRLLDALVDHEVREFLALVGNPELDYNAFHQQIYGEPAQKMLLDFVDSIVPNALKIKNATYEVVGGLTEKSAINLDDLDPKSTIAILLGNLRIESFEKTYELYKAGQISKIFISGNTRGSLKILDSLRKNIKYTSEIPQISDANAVYTVENLLSVNDDIFQSVNLELTTENFSLSLLDETLNTPISKKEIFNVVSNAGVTEAAIIAWVILENARQDGMNRKEINQLIKSIVLETSASNTPENIANIFSEDEFKTCIDGKENINIIVIQTPLSQKRAMATVNKILQDKNNELIGHDFRFIPIDFEMDFESTFYCYNKDLVEVLTRSVGEWIRLIAYTLKGDILPVEGNLEGLATIPLKQIINVLSLLPIFSNEEKNNLLKIFTETKDKNGIKIFQTKEDVLNILSNFVSKDSNRYKLIAELISYLYSDTTEQRLLENKWNDMKLEDMLPELVAEDELFEQKVENTHQILSAA